MKKILLVVLAFAFLGLSMTSFSQASRLKYQQQLYQRAHAKRSAKDVLKNRVASNDYRSMWVNRSYKNIIKPIVYKRPVKTLRHDKTKVYVRAIDQRGGGLVYTSQPLQDDTGHVVYFDRD